MRIGIFVQTWHMGGIAAYSERLALGLPQLGHSTVLILGTPYGKRDRAGQDAYERLAHGPFPVLCLHLNGFHPKERPWRAADAIAQLHCDALILSAHTSILGALPRLSSTSALVGIAHTDEPGTYAEFRAAESCCHAYVGVSAHIGRALADLRTNPNLLVRHVLSGVPFTEAVPDSVSSPEARVLVVSRLEQAQKRVLELPRIWREFIRRGGKGKLTICGSGEEEARLRELFADQLGAGNVTLTGAVPLAQMPDHYARHDLLLSVSAFEGLPLAVLEATTQGLFPVLSRTRSGHAEVVVCLGRGRLCGIDDADDFASALLEVTSDLSTLRRQRRAIAERARERFGLAWMLQSYSDLLRDTSARRLESIKPATGEMRRPRVDFIRRWLRRWQYNRHYGSLVGR